MRLYLFDLDGTLTDSRAGLYGSFRAGLAAIGCHAPTDADLAPFLGAPLPEVFRTMHPDVTPAQIEHGMLAFRAHYEQAGIYGNQLYPGARQMLLAVRGVGGTAWIVTSKPQGQAERVAALLDINTLVAGVIGAGLDETDTKFGLVGRALAAAGTSPDEALMLGDRHYDVIGARQNGVLPVGALWGYGSQQELAEAGCTRFVRTTAEFCADFLMPAIAKPHRQAALG